jgi:hypothetical protein
MTGAGTTNGGTTDGFTSTVVFSGIASTTRYKPIHINSTFVNNASANYTTADEGGTYVGDANAVTAVRIITHNGNAITGGQCSLYSLFN